MVHLTLSSEDELLLYLARINVNRNIVEKALKILEDKLDWNYIQKSSIKHGISSLLYWNLSIISDGEYLPTEVMANLENLYYGILARNIILYDELSNILKAHKDAGIDVIVLKGAFLAEIIYKNIGLRPMADLDLLIKKEDLQRVKMELAKLMYYSDIFPSKLSENWCTTRAEELRYKNQNKNVFFDIHWHIHPVQSPFRIDINKLWENAKPVKIAGIETLMLAPEDLLLHLCLHLDKHIHMGSTPTAKPLRDYCDIAEVTKHYRGILNWSYLLQSSKNYRIEGPIYQGLSIANQYFGAIIPKDFLSELRPVKSSIDFGSCMWAAEKR